jgi:polyvinyl alcohol dehydrogenase (cytochrome)
MKSLVVLWFLSLCGPHSLFAQGPVPTENICPGNPPMTDTAASPSWNGWGADVSNSRFQSQASARLSDVNVPELKLKWAFGFAGARAVSGQPVLVSGRVFVSADNNNVYSLDARTGCTYWSFKADATVRSSITIKALVVPNAPPRVVAYFGDARANVYAIEASTGNPIWKIRVDEHASARITGAPSLFEGRLYVPVASGEEGAGGSATYECCTFRGSVVAVDAATGRVAWKTYTIAEAPRPVGKNASGTQRFAPSGAAVWNSPTIDAKRRALYVGTGNAYSAPAANTTDSIMAMDLDSGKILWSVQDTADDVWLSICINQTRSETCGPDQDFGSPPILRTLANGSALLIAGQKSGNVWAHDPDRKGAVVWKTPLVSNTTEFGGKIIWGGAADEQNAYFGLGPGGIAAVKIETGERRWFTSLEPAPGGAQRPGQDGALTAIPGAVVSGGWDGLIRILSTRDGHVLWEYNTVRDFETVNHVAARGGSMGAPGPIVADGFLLVPSGYVGVRNGVPGNVLLMFSAN